MQDEYVEVFVLLERVFDSDLDRDSDDETKRYSAQCNLQLTEYCLNMLSV